MLRGSLDELVKRDLVEGSYILSLSKLNHLKGPGNEESSFFRNSVQLNQVKCDGEA
jgi:hypothetical protein